MGNFGGYYKGDKKKPKKVALEKKGAAFASQKTFVLPKVEILGKGKTKTSE